MERIIRMLNLMSAIILVVAAVYMNVAFDTLLSSVIRSIIGATVLLYFFLTAGRIAMEPQQDATVVPGSHS